MEDCTCLAQDTYKKKRNYDVILLILESVSRLTPLYTLNKKWFKVSHMGSKVMLIYYQRGDGSKMGGL